MPKTPNDAAPPFEWLKASALTFAYGDHTLFSGLELMIAPGVTLVQGGDGRGKSTLLRLLAGVMPATRGQVLFKGVALQQQAAKLRTQLFWTEARSDTHDQLTPPEYWASIRSHYPGFDDAQLPSLIDGLGLEPHLHKKLFMLSTGSKRKVWLTAAFASNALVTLIDEPYAALDGPSMAFVSQLLSEVAAKQERAVVMADYSAPDGVPLAGVIDLGD